MDGGGIHLGGNAERERDRSCMDDDDGVVLRGCCCSSHHDLRINPGGGG